MKNAIIAIALGSVVLLVLMGNRPREATAGAEEKQAGKEFESKPQAQELVAEIKKLHELIPDQAAVMTHVGYHFSNLWFAIKEENWDLADFYLSETRANLKWAVRTKPIRKDPTGKEIIELEKILQALDNTQLTQMKDAIKAKDKEKSAKLYQETLAGCYACHKASFKPYLRPQIPSSPEARMINFDPKAKEPQ
jgi:hypothetical protein